MSSNKDAEKLKEYFHWYIEEFLKLIKFDDFKRQIKKNNWLYESLNNIGFKDYNTIAPVLYGSIWRYEILDNLKFYITPKKTENIVTIFKMDRGKSLGKDRSVEFHTTFAFLYSVEENGKIEHQYLCLGPTFQSADGEYRRRFISYRQFKYLLNKYEELITKTSNELIKWIDKKRTNIMMEAFFPKYIKEKPDFTKIEKSFIEKIDNERLIIDIYTTVWLMEYKRYHDGTQEIHLVPGYMEAMFSLEDQKLYEKIKNLSGIIDDAFVVTMERVMTYPGRNFCPAICGQKLIPLRIKDVEECQNIRYTPWREMYIASLVGDLVINGISPSFPIFVDWFFIPTNSPDIWDNKVSHQKLDHSMVATDIVHKLEEARKNTYEFGSNGDEYYVTYQMQGMSEAIEIPIEYAEKELILAPVTLCSLVEHVGRTFADIIHLYKHPHYSKELGPIFTDIKIFAKYLFEYIYAIYSMNKHLHIIHTDLHLNNITLYSVRRFYKNIRDPNDNKPLVLNCHILYDLGDDFDENTCYNNTYIFPHYGKYAMIIDFSRGIVGRDQLMKDFPEHIVDQIISIQRKRLFKTIARELPDFVKAHAAELEAFLLQNFDLAFKLYTVLDTYKLTRGILGLFNSKIYELNIDSQIIKLLQHVNDIALNILTIDVQKAFRREIKEYELPNLRILKECFSAYTIGKFDQKASRRDDPNHPISIIDVYQIRNTIKYDIRKYDNFPPMVKFDYILNNKIPVNQIALENFEKYQKYLKIDPQSKIEEMSEELKAERAVRRGTPKPPDKSSPNSPKKSLKSSPKKEIHLLEKDKPSDSLSSSSI